MSRAGADGEARDSAETAGQPAGRRRRAVLLTACAVLMALLICITYVLHPPVWIRFGIVLAILIVLMPALKSAFRSVEGIVPIALTILALAGTFAVAILPNSSGPDPAPVTKYVPVIKYRAWVSCPDSLKGKAMVGPRLSIASTPVPSSLQGQLGRAHLDSVIAPDGSANVFKQERTCVNVKEYPGHYRTLWVILVLHLPPTSHPLYQNIYAVGELSDPAPGRYPVDIDRSCSNVGAGARHTLALVSADAQATHQLWRMYNARLKSLRTDCNANYADHSHRLPRGAYIIGNQGDVIQK